MNLAGLLRMLTPSSETTDILAELIVYDLCARVWCFDEYATGLKTEYWSEGKEIGSLARVKARLTTMSLLVQKEDHAPKSTSQPEPRKWGKKAPHRDCQGLVVRST